MKVIIVSVNNPGKCIHLKSGDGQNGDICHIWDIQGGSYPMQEWVYERGLLTSVNNPGKCIHLKTGDGRNGDVCHLWEIQCGSYPMQEWELRRI